MRKITKGQSFPLGSSVTEDGKVQFVIKGSKGKKYGVVLYDRKTGQKEILSFEEEHRIGNLYSIKADGIKTERISYLFLEDEREIFDPYAKVVYGNEKWSSLGEETLYAGIYQNSYNWENDRSPMIPLEQSILYQLHVRGFTKHVSSGVKKKGTFEGIVEKIPYLKELGITALECLPVYEFCECEREKKSYSTMEEALKENFFSKKEKLNYWGYKEGFYFAPKASYSATGKPQNSFKDMVKSLHREGMEVILQFFFPTYISRAFIIQVLMYWVKEYHVDGFRLMGVNIPAELIASMEEFQNIKILYETMNENEIYSHQETPMYSGLAVYNDSFMYALRRFLKSDVGSLQWAFHELMDPGGKVKKIVYLTNYNTFTLADLVSYNRKHNEENGEQGRDGNDNNVSWNCGAEGATRKKSVLELRKKQQKNGLLFLLLAKGTPVLLAGDEFANSQGGNNNPYCQDNNVSWLNWKDLERNKEQFFFCKQMIELRKKERFFLETKEERNGMEGKRFPRISFHGREAWKLEKGASNEEAGGILYSNEEGFLYIGINMFWKETELALPNLPLKEGWTVILDTCGKQEGEKIAEKTKQIRISSRSILILRSERKEDNDNKDFTTF